MTNDEIINSVASYLENRLLIGGELGQAGYRHDVLRLFAAAYRNAKQNPSASCITSDGLLEDISERWMLNDSEESNRKLKLLKQLCDMWREWQFAWDNYDSQVA